MNLRPFNDSQLPELMSWFPDRVSCRTWGGPEFRYPFDEASFREDSKVDSLPSWALVGVDGTLAAFGQYYSRLGRCHLSRLAAAPGWRGRGLGTTLIRELCSRGSAELGVDSYSLFVIPANESAMRLYRRLGFSPAAYPEQSSASEAFVYMVASSLRSTGASDPPACR